MFWVDRKISGVAVSLVVMLAGFSSPGHAQAVRDFKDSTLKGASVRTYQATCHSGKHYMIRLSPAESSVCAMAQQGPEQNICTPLIPGDFFNLSHQWANKVCFLN